jgi:hypothetical protein
MQANDRARQSRVFSLTFLLLKFQVHLFILFVQFFRVILEDNLGKFKRQN